MKIMCDLNDECNKSIMDECGKKVLCLALNKTLRVWAQSALLWCKLLSTTLLEMGFTLIPYNLCVTNKITRGCQCTIVSHVDDRTISNKSQSFVKSIFENIESNFGKMSSVSYGLDHDSKVITCMRE